MQYVRLGRVSDFDGARFKTFRLLARPVGVFKDTDGSFFAVEVSCKHQNADLTTGRMNGFRVTCPRHGWEYDLKTGECLNHPSAPLRRYGVKVENGEIWVTLTPMGEPLREGMADEFS